MENGIEGINQTLQDIIWHGLPKHAIEAIIIGYGQESHKPQKDQYTLGVLHTYEGLFGFQNLKDPWRFISKTETTAESESLNFCKFIANYDKSKPNPLNNMEEKELNLCKILERCDDIKLYSLHIGEVTLTGVADANDPSLESNGKAIRVENPTGLIYYRYDGRVKRDAPISLFPSKELYEKYPLNPRKAWQEWKERQKPYRLNLLITDEVQKNERWVPVFRIPEIRFRTKEEKEQAVNEIKALLEDFHKGKEADQ